MIHPPDDASTIARLRYELGLVQDALANARADIERMQSWLDGDCNCPCCDETRICHPECTFAADCPEDSARMNGARQVRYGDKT